MPFSASADLLPPQSPTRLFRESKSTGEAGGSSGSEFCAHLSVIDAKDSAKATVRVTFCKESRAARGRDGTPFVVARIFVPCHKLLVWCADSLFILSVVKHLFCHSAQLCFARELSSDS